MTEIKKAGTPSQAFRLFLPYANIGSVPSTAIILQCLRFLLNLHSNYHSVN